MPDSETYSLINHFFVNKAISTNYSSKYSYIQVLKMYIDRIGLLLENAIFTSR